MDERQGTFSLHITGLTRRPKAVVLRRLRELFPDAGIELEPPREIIAELRVPQVSGLADYYMLLGSQSGYTQLLSLLEARPARLVVAWARSKIVLVRREGDNVQVAARNPEEATFVTGEWLRFVDFYDELIAATKASTKAWGRVTTVLGQRPNRLRDLEGVIEWMSLPEEAITALRLYDEQGGRL